MSEPQTDSDRHESHSELDVFREIRSNFVLLRQQWKTVALTTAVFVTIGILYSAGTKRIYQADTRLLVLQLGGRPLNVANAETNQLMDGAEDYIPTHAQIISSPAVVRSAIETIGVKNLPSLQPSAVGGLSPVEVVINNLKVTRPDRTAKILIVEYRSSRPEEAFVIVNGIIDAYRAFLKNTFRSNSNKIVDLIGNASNDLRADLEKLEEDYRLLRGKSLVLLGGEEQRAFLGTRLSQLDRASNEAMVKSLHIEAQLGLGKKLLQKGSELWAVAHAINQMGGDSTSLMTVLAGGSSQSGANELVRLLSREKLDFAEKFGPQYAKVRETQSQIDKIRARERGARSRLEVDEANDLIDSIQESLLAARDVKDQLRRQFEAAMKEAKAVEQDLLKEEEVKGRLERQRLLFNTVVDQLKQARLLEDYSSTTAEVIQAAEIPRRTVWPRSSLIIALAAALGCMTGVGLTVIIDRFDSRVRSVEEVRQISKLALIGQVPVLPRETVGGQDPPALISLSNPRSIWAEAFRAVRTNIDFLRRRSPGLQAIQITSANAGEGKSTTACNLAICLATAGRRILLIDADMRRPTIGKTFNLEHAYGLSQALQGTRTLREVIQRSAVDGLDIVAAGLNASNPDTLLLSSRFDDLLKEARLLYDIVLVDTPPVLAVSDAAIIGTSVDGIVLIANLAFLRRRDFHQTLEIVRNVGIPVLGTVVNQVTRDLSNYGYGYGYGYGERVYGQERNSENADLKPVPPKSDGT